MLPIVDIEVGHSEGLVNSFMTKNDSEAIFALLRRVQAKRIVEFGLNYGFTAREILNRVAGIEQYVGIDLDSFDAGSPKYVPTLFIQHGEVVPDPGREIKNDPRVRLLMRRRGSFDLCADDIGIVDAALVDGDHSRAGVENDSLLAYSCVRRGGVVMWHDYSDTSQVAVPEVLHMFNGRGHQIFWIRGTSLAFEMVNA